MKRGIAAVVSGAVMVAALFYFQPWRAFTSSEIDESAPVSASVADTGVGVEPTETRTPPKKSKTRSAPTASKPKNTVLAEGQFEDAEYETSGAVRVLELADGRRFLRIEGLATSDGPDLNIWLTDQPSGGEWGSYDDGRFLDLGALKATNGNLNYEIPAGANLAGLRSVAIWCDRFNVATGTAPVTL